MGKMVTGGIGRFFGLRPLCHLCQQINEDGTATVKDTLYDVAGGQALGGPAAKIGKATGEAVPEVGRLTKSAARDDRIAQKATRKGRRVGKELEAQGKRQQAADIVTRRTAAASIAASELGSKVFENPEKEK